MPIFELIQPPILVGVDGSPSSRAALRWAYAEAVRSGTPLQVLTAWPSVSRTAGHIDTEEQARAVAELLVAEELPRDHHDVLVWVSPYSGAVDDVLMRRAYRAELLVVGPHSAHSVTEHLLGSVTEHLLAESPCPVAVVPACAGAAPVHHRLVVGVDGEAASIEALRWAARYALDADLKVDALLVWDWHPEYGVYPYGPDERHQRAHAEAVLARTVVTLPDELRTVVHSEPVRGRPADVLLAAADTADLVVVGNRRAGHLATHLLGSVSRAVAMNARVPVVVTHAR